VNLHLMSLNIRQFCPDLSIPVIRQRINIRYKQLLRAEDWEFLSDNTTVILKARYDSADGETVAIDQYGTNVTGTSTVFSSLESGYFFRFGTESQAYEVSTINSDTSLTLATSYGGTTQTASSFSYFKSIYSPPVGDVAEIVDIVYQQPLREVTLSYLDSIDPERSTTGSPRYYRIVDKTKSSGVVRFEIWPIPDQDYVVRVFYKKLVSELTSNNDEPVFDPEVLEAGALWDCYRIEFTLTKNPAYIGLARDAPKGVYAFVS